MFNILPQGDTNEREFEFLMTTEQLHRYSISRTQNNEGLQQGDEL